VDENLLAAAAGALVLAAVVIVVGTARPPAALRLGCAGAAVSQAARSGNPPRTA
jgi:hypothetical protein